MVFLVKNIHCSSTVRSLLPWYYKIQRLLPGQLIICSIQALIRYSHINQGLLSYLHPAGSPKKRYNEQGQLIPIFSRGHYPHGATKPSEKLQSNSQSWEKATHVLLHHRKGQIECFIQHRTQPGQAIMIAFSGNGQCFTQPHSHQEALAQLRLKDSYQHLAKTTLILVNHPGVGRSAFYGRARQAVDDLYDSAWIACQFFLQTPWVLPEHVTIFGHSLGGVVASKVASECHRHHQKVHLIVSRSLASSPLFLWSHLPRLMLGFFWLIIPLSFLTQTSINSAKNYFSISEPYRFAFEAIGDELMKPKACLSQHWRRPRYDQSIVRLQSTALSNDTPDCIHNELIDLEKLYQLPVKPALLLEDS